MAGIAIIGAGQAGAALAAKLRSEGYEGEIALFGRERVPPYQRPPLSKAYLLGESPKERLFLRPETFYADQNISLHLGQTITKIDAAAQSITTAEGAVFIYDQLAFTTGAEPRRLSAEQGGDLGNVLTMRSMDDADRLAPLLEDSKRAVIIGGGYIGLEAAAVCAKRGMQVTVIEATPRILGRVACEETATYFRDLHEGNGVTIREGVGLDRLSGTDVVQAVHLTSGETLAADLVLVGIGIIPETQLAEAAGVALDRGIATDEMGATSLPHIWAAGDCTSLPYRGERIRLESVQNAIDQAEAVACNMLGAATPYVPKPWFWSDQYDTKLQIAGLNTGYDRIVIRDNGEGARSHWYYQGDTLLAVDAMNDPRAYMVGKRLIEAGKSPDAAAIQDTSGDIKSLLR